jgi:hypothetical protein
MVTDEGRRMTINGSRTVSDKAATGWKIVARLFPMLTLMLLYSCGDNDTSSTEVAFVINKSSGQVDVCQLTSHGLVNFANCKLASTTTFSQPIDMVMIGNTVLMSVETGIEQCTRAEDELVSCDLAISDSGFPVNLTLANQLLFVADYSAKSIVSYTPATLQPVATKSLPTSPTHVVFNQGVGYIVTQDIAGSVVLACNQALDNCRSVYNPLDRALLAMAIDNGVAFLTDASKSNVVSCDVGADGSLSDCAVQGDNTIFNYPYGITIRNNVAYIPNRAEATITVCNVSGKNLLNCSKSTNALFDGPTWVIFG